MATTRLPTEPATSGQSGRRLVLAFDAAPAPESACRPTTAMRPERLPPPTLLAVYCSDALPVAAVEGRATGADARSVERLVWQATGQLFPDDWESSYGLNWLFGDGGKNTGM